MMNCQRCGRPCGETHSGCYHCSGTSHKSGFVCGLCVSLYMECPDCANTFCPRHIDPRVHVRNGWYKAGDTCAKRTACLNRIFDGVERKKARVVSTPSRV